MNSRQLQKLGVPEECVHGAIAAIQSMMKTGGIRGKQVKQAIRDVIDRPRDFTEDEHLGQFAKDVIDERSFVRPEPIDYQTWGTEIDDATRAQMKQACGVPMAAGAALMPDAHVGYGLYKNIEDVMREQADLVEAVARFDPRIVKMCDDGSKPED